MKHNHGQSLKTDPSQNLRPKSYITKVTVAMQPNHGQSHNNLRLGVEEGNLGAVSDSEGLAVTAELHAGRVVGHLKFLHLLKHTTQLCKYCSDMYTYTH